MGIMNLTEILDKSVDVLRKYIKSIVTYTLGYGFLLLLAMIPLIIVIVIIFAFTGVGSGFGSGGYIALIIAYLLFFAVMAAAVISYRIGIIKIAAQEFFHGPIYAFDAIKASFKNILKIMGIITAAFLLFLPVLGILGTAGYFLYKAVDASGLFNNSYNTDLLLGSYNTNILLICLVVAASLIAVFVISAYMTLFTFALHAAVIENKGVIGSIRRSLNLIKNDFWRIFGCVVLFSLVVAAITYALESFFALLFGMIYLILTLSGFEQDFTTFITLAYTYARWPINIVSWVVISPAGVIMTTLLYFNQRFKKEGFDLTLKLTAIRKNIPGLVAGGADSSPIHPEKTLD